MPPIFHAVLQLAFTYIILTDINATYRVIVLLRSTSLGNLEVLYRPQQ